MVDKKFLVRVECLTYNHASYIKDAMNGFTMQQTNFPYICVIIDDASTDGEPEVIQKYMQNNFELENPITQQDESDDCARIFSRHKENKNCFFLVVLLKYNHYSSGKTKYPYYKDWVQGIEYIATCEGDDYWIDPEKLQKQVDYFSEHPRCSYLFTNRYIDHEESGIRQEIRYQKNKYSTHDILSGFIPGLQTVMYKRGLMDSSILQTKGINLDRLNAYAYSSIGEVQCLHDITAVYRNTGKGSSTGVSQDVFFNHVVSDMMRFHRNLNAHDWLAYCKGQSKNLGTYGAGLPKWKRLFGVYAAFRKIDDRINIITFMVIFLLFIKNKIYTRFNLNDPKVYSVCKLTR